MFASLWLSLAHAADKAILFENVFVFDGRSAERARAPANVLVVGDTIQAISAAPIEPPTGPVSRSNRRNAWPPTVAGRRSAIDPKPTPVTPRAAKSSRSRAIGTG